MNFANDMKKFFVVFFLTISSIICGCEKCDLLTEYIISQHEVWTDAYLYKLKIENKNMDLPVSTHPYFHGRLDSTSDIIDFIQLNIWR